MNHVNHVHEGRDGFASIAWVPPARRWALMIAGAFTLAILVRFPFLPETVPTHYDFLGRPDGYGPRWTVLLLAGILLTVIVSIAFFSRRTDLHNGSQKVTEERAEEFHQNGERTMVRLLLFIVGLYGVLVLGYFGVPATPLALPILAVMMVWMFIDVLKSAPRP